MKEFADFLGGQPPFDGLDPDDLMRLAAHVEAEFFAAGATVVRRDEQLDHLWVVRTGSLAVLDDGRVVDLLGPGDAFGHVAMLSQLPPGLQVRAAEESLCLRIPDPRTYLARPQRLRFAELGPPAHRGRLVDQGLLAGSDRDVTQLMRPVIWCLPTDRIRDAAHAVGAAGQSCALVRTARGLGIVTDLDFRRRVATGELAPEAPVAELATVPALTIGEGARQSAALLAMVEHGVHHLVVVDESDQPTGIVRVVDLARFDARDPLLIRQAIDHATTLSELAEVCRSLPDLVMGLRHAGIPAVRVAALHSAVVDAVIRRVLSFRGLLTVEDPRCSWVLLGSLARREPLPQSDLDTALIWGDPPEGSADPAEAARAEAALVLADLQRCGLVPCPNGANATNPLFGRSQSAWSVAARSWMHDPTREGALLLSAMVADSRPLTDVALGRHLTDGIRSHTRTSQFLRALLDEALAWRPPSGFVRDFIVHHTGEHRGELDLKRGGLAPLVALGRWCAIASGDARGTTPDRLRRGAKVGLLTDDEALALARGFDDIFTLLMDHEIETMRSGGAPGTFIAPSSLDSLARRHLRASFRVIAQVQAHIDQEWAHRLERLRSAG